MIKDYYRYQRGGLESPAVRAVEVAPSDTEDLPFICRAISVNLDGVVRLTPMVGDPVSITIFAGTPFPIRARRIHATGTTADGIVVLS